MISIHYCVHIFEYKTIGFARFIFTQPKNTSLRPIHNIFKRSFKMDRFEHFRSYFTGFGAD